MKVGFTGTRNGMSPAQRTSFIDLIKNLNPSEFHHGDCIGADAEAHDIIAEVLNCLKVIHPPIDTAHRAYRNGETSHEPKTHLARNRSIVDQTDVLIGISISPIPLERGGTWYTINYAQKTNKLVHVIWPNGHITIC